MLGFVALAVWPAPATVTAYAAEGGGGTRVGGSWTMKTTPTQQRLPSGLGLSAGTMTLTFGSGCQVGSACTVTMTPGKGKATKQPLSGNRISWRTTEALDCIDNATGAVTTPHGADYTVVGNLRPTGFTEQDGVRWVTRMSGTIRATATINAAGRADDCTIPPQDTLSATDTATLSATQVPLAAPKPSGPAREAAVDPETTTSAGTLPEFTLRLSDDQAASRAAVADGRRSAFPASVQTLPEAVGSLGDRLPKVSLLVAVLGLLMVFPAQLFNGTYEENHERIDARLRRLARRRTPHRAAGRAKRFAVFVACLLVGTVLGGLLDPSFGANVPSYALLVGVAGSVVVGIAIAILAARGFRRVRHEDPHWFLRAIPSALIVAALCVAVSRLTHFEPGYLYGVLGGAVFVTALKGRDEGRAELTGMVAGLAVALVAWVLFTPVSAAANAADPSFAVLATDALLAALFVGGLEGALFALLPLRFLPGGRLFAWSKAAWVVTTLGVLVLFVHVLLMPASGYLGRSTEASVGVTIALFAAFATVSVLFWLYFRMRPTPEVPDEPGLEPGEVEPVAVDVPVEVPADLPGGTPVPASGLAVDSELRSEARTEHEATQ